MISHHISAALASQRRDTFLAEKQAADRARQARSRRRRAAVPPAEPVREPLVAEPVLEPLVDVPSLADAQAAVCSPG